MLILEVVVSGELAFQHEEESSRKEYVQALLASEYLLGAAAGIAKLVLDQGESALKGEQIAVFRSVILGNEHGKTCKVCGPLADWDDRAFAIEDKDGYCPRCRRDMDNED